MSETFNQEDLSTEQQTEVTELSEDIQRLKKKIEGLKAEIGFIGLQADIYEAGLRITGDATDSEDEMEIASFEDKIGLMRRDRDYARQELYALEQEGELDTVNPELGGTLRAYRSDIQEQMYTDLIDNTTDIEFKSDDLSEMSAGDIYSLKMQGVDLVKLFLLKGEKSTSNEDLQEGDSLVVNFGKHTQADQVIGAGDLLSPEIKKITVNGVAGERKNIPRPGYYTPEGKYLAIHDNYKIEVLERGELTPEELNIAQDASNLRYSEVRRTEFMRLIYENKDASTLDVSSFSPKDLEIFEQMTKDILPDQENISFDKKTGILEVGSGNFDSMLQKIYEYQGHGTKHLEYKDHLNTLSDKYGIPAGMITRLIYHENGSWNPGAQNPGSTAYGLGQMIDGTWNTYGKGLNRYDPKDQLEATAKYMSDIHARQNCSWEEVLAYYNTGEGIQNISQSKTEEYARRNSVISNKIPMLESLTPDTYFTAAVAYYNDISYQEAKEKIS